MQSDSTFTVHLDTSGKRIHLEDFAKGDSEVYSERELILFLKSISNKKEGKYFPDSYFPWRCSHSS